MAKIHKNEGFRLNTYQKRLESHALPWRSCSANDIDALMPLNGTSRYLELAWTRVVLL